MPQTDNSIHIFYKRQSLLLIGCILATYLALPIYTLFVLLPNSDAKIEFLPFLRYVIGFVTVVMLAVGLPTLLNLFRAIKQNAPAIVITQDQVELRPLFLSAVRLAINQILCFRIEADSQNPKRMRLCIFTNDLQLPARKARIWEKLFIRFKEVQQGTPYLFDVETLDTDVDSLSSVLAARLPPRYALRETENHRETPMIQREMKLVGTWSNEMPGQSFRPWRPHTKHVLFQEDGSGRIESSDEEATIEFLWKSISEGRMLVRLAHTKDPQWVELSSTFVHRGEAVCLLLNEINEVTDEDELEREATETQRFIHQLTYEALY